MQADAEIFLEHGQIGTAPGWSPPGCTSRLPALLILFGVLLPRQWEHVGRRWRRGRDRRDPGQQYSACLPARCRRRTCWPTSPRASRSRSRKEKENEPDAIPIPDKSTKIKPKPVTSASKAKPQPQAEEPSNEVPFGQGGPVSGPYGTFSADGAKGGFGVQGGGGDFGTLTLGTCKGFSGKDHGKLAEVRNRPEYPASQSRLCHVRHQSVRPAERMCRSSNPAEFPRWTSRRCGPFNASIRLVRLPPNIPATR